MPTLVLCSIYLSVFFHTQGAGVTRNFDLCVAPKSVAGEATKPYVFSGVDRSEYSSLYSFLSTKKLRIKNIKQSGNDGAMLQLGNVDEHDAYKAALDEDQVTHMFARAQSAVSYSLHHKMLAYKSVSCVLLQSCDCRS